MEQTFSYWEHSSFLSAADITIVGSGIVGLTAALHIKRSHPALQVTVLEAGFLPSGASTKNAGFACFGSVSELLDELKNTPEEELLKTVELRWKGLQKLRENLGDQAIDYHGFGGYDVFKTGEIVQAEECIAAIPNLNRMLKDVIGRADIYAVDNEKITGFGFKGIGLMICNRYEGQIDTGKMMRALLQKVQAEGVLVFNNCKLEKIERDNTGLNLITNQAIFKTRKVILATNAYTSKFYPGLDIKPGRGQVLITEPIEGLPVKGTFHYDKGYYYFRNINSRILLGGGRNLDFKAEETDKAGITSRIQNALEDLLYTSILPGRKPKIDYRWSGIMGFGNDLKPIVKKLEPDIFCAARCNGMGVAMGSLVGEQVAGLALEGF